MPAPRSAHRFLPTLRVTCALLLGWVVVIAAPAFTLGADNIPTNDAGQRHGRVTLEHLNGQTRVTATYRAGLLHSRLERRTDSGQRLEIARYRDGQREGTRQVFRDGEIVLTQTYEQGQRTAQEGDASADPGPPTFAIGTNGLANGASETTPADDDDDPTPNTPPAVGERPEHQRDTAQKPNGYPFSIDDLTRAFERIDNLRIEGDPDEQQSIVIRRLIKSRLVSGIADPIIAFDADEAHLAQRACEVLHALGRLDHDPPNPGLPVDVYNSGHEGASRSNIGSGMNSGGPAISIERWLVDAGSNNRDEVGHRRWCLTPGLYETAYGLHAGYAALLVVGNIRDHVTYDILTYPGPGYQPVEFYDRIHRYPGQDLIWSIHLNPQTYQTPPSVDQLLITVYQVLPDGRKTEIEVRRTRIAEKERLLATILFDPAISVIEEGAVYEVTLQGIERRRRPYTLTYRVEFYEAGDSH